MNEGERHPSAPSDPGIGAGRDRTPEEIEREIELTRERMSRDIDALGEKLSPQYLKRQARKAIAGKTQDLVKNVGGRARDTGGRLAELFREHPLPVVAAGLGALWLFKPRNRTEIPGDRGSRARRQGSRARKHLMKDNPLALAAGGAILGLFLDMLVPGVERKNRWMRRTRDNLVDRGQTTASRVKTAALEATNEVRQAVREEATSRAPEIKATFKDAARGSGTRGTTQV